MSDCEIDWQQHPACGICQAIDGLTLSFVHIEQSLRHYLPRLPLRGPEAPRPLAIRNSDFSQPLLGPLELARVNAFQSRKRQTEWMAGRLAAKNLAAFRTADTRALPEIGIAYHPEGAPYLENRPDLSLSISHAGDVAVAGLGHTGAIALGLDIEQKQNLDIDSILRVAFSDRERRALPPGDQDRFFECWTLKEAYLKYLGRGFRENLKQVEILDGTAIRHHGQIVPGLRARILRPFPEYTLAVVAGTP